MNKDWKYGIALLVSFIIIITYQLYGPKPIDWRHSFSKEDKIPYGNYLLYSRLRDIFPGKSINSVSHTIYETSDKTNSAINYIFINESFTISKLDLDKLLELVSNGAVVFIASNNISKELMDTLTIEQTDKLYTYSDDSTKIQYLPDSISLKITAKSAGQSYYFKREAITSYFTISDSSNASVLGRNQFGNPVLITVSFGAGNFILSSTPLVYSNFNMVHGNNARFISQSLSFLPVRDVLWDEYYIKPSRKNTATPLRFILSEEGLRWALYIALITIILFMFFEAKRRQRIIPILKAPANDSLEFIKTIGQLYSYSKNVKGACNNKITYFNEFVRRTYLLRTTHMDNTYIELLSKKSGVEKETVKELVSLINFIQSSASVKEEHLLKLNHLIKEFQKTVN